MEYWKIIEGTNNRYEVSNLGHIKCDGELLETVVDNSGYVKARISLIFGTRWFWVHRIVAAYFCENPDNKPQVNHIDGNKENNISENLEWCTSAENQRHRIDILGKDCKGKNNPMYGKTGELCPTFKGYILQIDINTNEIVGKYAGSGDASRKTGFKMGGINKAACGYLKTYKGFKWIREDEYISGFKTS